MNGSRELNGNRSCSKVLKSTTSPSNKKVVTIVSPKEVSHAVKLNDPILISPNPNDDFRGKMGKPIFAHSLLYDVCINFFVQIQGDDINTEIWPCLNWSKGTLILRKMRKASRNLFVFTFTQNRNTGSCRENWAQGSPGLGENPHSILAYLHIKYEHDWRDKLEIKKKYWAKFRRVAIKCWVFQNICLFQPSLSTLNWIR